MSRFDWASSPATKQVMQVGVTITTETGQLSEDSRLQSSPFGDPRHRLPGWRLSSTCFAASGSRLGLRAVAQSRIRPSMRLAAVASLPACETVNRCAALSLRARHVRLPEPPRFARGACYASSSVADGDERPSGGGLHSWRGPSRTAYRLAKAIAVQKRTSATQDAVGPRRLTIR